MNQLTNTNQQHVREGIQPLERPDPNQLVAMSLYFPPLTPALIGLCVVVLVAVLSSAFPTTFFWGTASPQGIIAILSVLSAFLFLEASRMGFLAHSNDLYGMDVERRKSIFEGNDPFEEGIQNTDWFDWEVIKEKADVISRMYLYRGMASFVFGLIALFLAVSFLMASYIFLLGIVTSLLTCIYAATQVVPQFNLIRLYFELRSKLKILKNTLPPKYRPHQTTSTPAT